MKKIFALILFLVAFNVQATDVPNMLSGGKVTLDGTIQKVTFTLTNAAKILLLKNGTVTIGYVVNGAGGCQVGAESIVATHDILAQGTKGFVTVSPSSTGTIDIYVKGTNTQTVSVFL